MRKFFKALMKSKPEPPREATYDIPLVAQLMSTLPAVIAFEIDNGYLICARGAGSGNFANSPRTTGITYCADHQAIADHLVTRMAKSRLGVQGDLFPEEKEAALRQQYTVRANQP